jgi:hypothetical protein
MPVYKLTGPKGGAIVKRANIARVRKILPALVRRLGKVSVSPAAPLPPDYRARIVKWAHWGVANEPSIHYAETRPMPLHTTLPMTTDCSGFATLCYFLAGAPDPNGLGYNGQGYTGTFLDHGKRVTKAQARPGDVIVYGPGTGWHMAVIVEAGGDPLTVSHGQEKGPALCRVSQDGRVPQTFLSFLP